MVKKNSRIKEFVNGVIVDSTKNFSTAKGVALMGVLLAVAIILKTISLPVYIGGLLVQKISFAYIAMAIVGMIFGPIPAAVVGAATDIIGYVLFPVGGGYFPGNTLSYFFAGFIYGVFLYNPNLKNTEPQKSDTKKTIKIIIAQFINNIFINFGLNTLWLRMTKGIVSDLLLIIVFRIIVNLGMWILCSIILIMLYQIIKKLNITRKFVHNK